MEIHRTSEPILVIWSLYRILIDNGSRKVQYFSTAVELYSIADKGPKRADRRTTTLRRTTLSATVASLRSPKAARAFQVRSVLYHSRVHKACDIRSRFILQ